MPAITKNCDTRVISTKQATDLIDFTEIKRRTIALQLFNATKFQVSKIEEMITQNSKSTEKLYWHEGFNKQRNR